MTAPAKPIPLCVPWWDESRAIDTGARYDQKAGWYMPADELPENFLEWLPRLWNPTWTGPVLVPDMLPSTTWGDNVRSRVPPARWDVLRRYCYSAAGGRCEICGRPSGTTLTPHLEAHELWVFDDATHVQRLDRLLALCPTCHKSHHLGFANRLGILDEVLLHIRRVNRWSEAQLDDSLAVLKAQWERRSKQSWSVDISWVETYRPDEPVESLRRAQRS